MLPEIVPERRIIFISQTIMNQNEMDRFGGIEIENRKKKCRAMLNNGP